MLSVADALAVASAYTLAATLRFGSGLHFFLMERNGLLKIGVVTCVYIACFYCLDLYEAEVLTNRVELWKRLLQGLVIGTLLLFVLFLVFPAGVLNPPLLMIGLPLLIPFFLISRPLYLGVFRGSLWVQRAVIIGNGSLACSLIAELHRRPDAGIELMGYVDVAHDPNANNGLQYLGAPEVLNGLIERNGVDQIIVAMGDRRGNLPVQQLLGLKAQGIDVRDGMDVYEALNRQVHVDSARLTSWLLFSGGYRVSKGMLFYKRLFSIIFSLLGLLVTLPLMGLIALVIRLDSEGPAIFRQERVGKDGKIFTLFKFRSMFDGADQDGKHKPAQIRDGRCTRVGRVLRRTRLDELPQLYNILRGDMYFIGPRPFVPDQEEKLATKIPYYEQRWTVKPGATGWAQVSRGYCVTIEDNVEKLSYDLFYIKNMSMGLDVLILLKTLKVLLLGRGGR